MSDIPEIPSPPNGMWWDSDAITAMTEYGELCRKQAIEEAIAVCETRTDRINAIKELLK